MLRTSVLSIAMLCAWSLAATAQEDYRQRAIDAANGVTRPHTDLDQQTMEDTVTSYTTSNPPEADLDEDDFDSAIVDVRRGDSSGGAAYGATVDSMLERPDIEISPSDLSVANDAISTADQQIGALFEPSEGLCAGDFTSGSAPEQFLCTNVLASQRRACVVNRVVSVDRDDTWQCDEQKFNPLCNLIRGTPDCEREEPLAECEPFKAVETSDTWPVAAGQCVETSSVCIEMFDFFCETTRKTFRCLNGPPDGGDAINLERVFFNLTETMADTCESTLPESCSFVLSGNLHEFPYGANTRIINELVTTRSWWSRINIYDCGQDGWVNSCPEFEARPNCVSMGVSQCLAYDSDGNCEYEEQTYDCDGGVEYSASCTGDALCEDGTCDGVPEEAGDDFGDAGAWLTFLDDAAKANNCDADPSFNPNEENPELTDCQEGELEYTEPQVFGGSRKHCSDNAIYNCCSSSSYYWCADHEPEISDQIAAGLTHYLNTVCSNTILFGTVCVEDHKNYCVYNSKFARVFQEQANEQIGGRFSGSTACSALTIAQMETLDMELMDFSEVFGEMINDSSPLVRELVLEGIQENLLGIAGEAQDVFQ